MVSDIRACCGWCFVRYVCRVARRECPCHILGTLVWFSVLAGHRGVIKRMLIHGGIVGDVPSPW